MTAGIDCYMMECTVIETQSDLLGVPVVSKRGRDTDRPGVILGWTPGGFALVADGRRRTVANPKKKNMKHLKFFTCRRGELGAKLRNGERVTDLMVREELSVLGGFIGEGKQYG